MAQTRILLCEDDQLLRKTITCLLETSGYMVADFETADEVLRFTSSELESFDLLITDIEMPGTSGLELSRQVALRAPDVAIFVMSGHNVDPATIERIGAGFFAKPFHIPELLRAIRISLARRNCEVEHVRA